jgi:hypothetical protein
MIGTVPTVEDGVIETNKGNKRVHLVGLSHVCMARKGKIASSLNIQSHWVVKLSKEPNCEVK